MISLIQKFLRGYLKEYFAYKKVINLNNINFTKFQKIILIIFLNFAYILSKIKNILLRK